ncbi:peptidoglycan DD-metalloendopeptidase family protein [Chitiniphilus purpureus]|uniref:Peptidoglycan DD-metalloendopeptidase family protein n=1 Tax=Chitiniphilus purpureus TaxID=2981137 RepID=A0ABY6DIZ0_9NEIS|nr:peptidoglycan DD-metalloendopeptidase family protein [Chitiniphilus sp. CD1]UXY14012.1 peptidoglycan DD-metalloendopeptidase family protein [Chitiniphilus sp. CD1]
MNRLYWIASIFAAALAGCASEPRSPAPIVDGTVRSTAPAPAPAAAPAPAPVAVPSGSYLVKRGDTLYRIALDNGLDYRELAAWNNLGDLNGIKVGQLLRLSPPADTGGVEVKPLQEDGTIATAPAGPAAPAPVATPVKAPVGTAVPLLSYPKGMRLPYDKDAANRIAAAAEGQSVASKPQPVPAPVPASNTASTVANAGKNPEKAQPDGDRTGSVPASWLWPTAGRVTKGFTNETKGIDIAGKMGQPIVASGSGKVVYAGAGLRGYGKMLIIKHDKEYLTAYAHNSKLIVKEGDVVKRGEKIAEMGDSDTDQVKLHFEIRRFGKPVDPAKYIQTEMP